LRRIQTPIEKSGKLLAPRKLHGTSWGFVCPVETPEGHSVGIVKTVTTLTSITQHTPSVLVVRFLETIPGIQWITNLKDLSVHTSLILNGVIIAYTSNPVDVHKKLQHSKRSFRLHPQTSIAWNISENSITVETDGGRFTRPLFRVENGKILSPPTNPTCWNDWITSCIEYIDPLQSEVIRIAMTPGDVTKVHTHCEIHPTMILGHMAASIPLSDHNQSPRNTYQSAMGKQSVGIFARNYAKRLDKNGYILCSPMRPFVETRMMNILDTHQMPS
jgi:DNA-directed RNA polymerase II subunit RPB2